MSYIVESLPLVIDLETKAVLKKTASVRSALAEMKGAAASIPNDSILIDTLPLREAKDSSAIENNITTHDELFQSDYHKKQFKTIATKEVQHYAQALRTGFRTVKQKGLLTNNQILHIQAELEQNRAYFRRQHATWMNSPTSRSCINSSWERTTIT